jgi:glycosyltransferase involved in cell wall biosynthesis
MAAFEEEATVGDVVTGCRRARPDCEVIVVDDGSRDRTSTIARRAGATVLRLRTNAGKGRALRTGIEHARGDIVVFLDADGQDDPADLPRLVAPVEAGAADLVIGSRFAGELAPGAISTLHAGGNRALTTLINALYGRRLTDTQAGFRAIRRSVLRRADLRASGFDVESDVLLAALALGARVLEVPVRRHARRHGASHLCTVRDGLAILARIVDRRLAVTPTRGRSRRSRTGDGRPSR